MTLQDMAEFHLEFETIHPFQDGNGRIGRFLLLKQCLACNRDPICIHSESAQAYRNALQLSRVEKNIEPLAEVFQSAQKISTWNFLCYMTSEKIMSRKCEI